jgi:protein-S-isoprenylcysteine O-methyltransferase Ste14
MPVLRNTELSSVTVAITAGILGFVVMLSAWWQFRKHQVAICPTDATDHLISDGVYRLTRNPMYLGMILMMFGVAIFFGTVLFFAAAIVYFAIINWFFCPYEEDKLTREFGREFESYRARVRRWL